jgi:raffinose/stachyose/melibiose transport system permease protein
VTRSWSRGLFLAISSVGFLVPLYIILATALRPATKNANSVAPSADLAFANFREAWVQSSMGNALMTSLAVTTASVTIILSLGVVASYYFGRNVGWSRNIAYLCMSSGLVLPFQLGIIPLFDMLRGWALVGNPIGLILSYSALGMPLCTFILTAFVKRLPSEFEDAGRVDGCATRQILRWIVLPQLRPAMTTVAVLSAIAIWNDLFLSLLILGNDPERRTLPLAIYSFAGQYGASWNLIFAGITISLAPVLAFYSALQTRVVDSFAAGLKG